MSYGIGKAGLTEDTLHRGDAVFAEETQSEIKTVSFQTIGIRDASNSIHRLFPLASKMMTRSLFICLLIAVFCFAAFAQDTTDADEITVDTALVSIPVTVSDKQGRYISGLNSQDFQLLHDGKVQKIDFFASEEESINVVLLLDTSPSTAGVIDKIKNAAFRFVDLLGIDDKAMIVSFDTEIQRLSPLTSEKAQLKQAIRNASIGFRIGTVMRDAVANTLAGQFGDVKGRKAIILLTDGMDFGSMTTTASLLYRLEESDTMIYTVYFKTEVARQRNGPISRRNGRAGRQQQRRNPRFPSGNGRNRQADLQKSGREFLKEMSTVTAGRYYDKNIDDLSATFSSIVDELRHQYRLGFYAPEKQAKGEIHQIKVKVNKKNVSVRFRPAYRSK